MTFVQGLKIIRDTQAHTLTVAKCIHSLQNGPSGAATCTRNFISFISADKINTAENAQLPRSDVGRLTAINQLQRSGFFTYGIGTGKKKPQ
jgi:hypothetical protein